MTGLAFVLACSPADNDGTQPLDGGDDNPDVLPEGTGGGVSDTAVGSGGATSLGGASSTGGTSTNDGTGGETATELVLDGDAPAESAHPANGTHWTLLPDTDEFTAFSGNAPFAIAPLDSKNFPAGYDYCTASGGDAEINGKQQWARAELKADLKTWYYDVTLISVPEEDGNTPYQLLVDGVVLGEFTTPEVGSDLDRVDHPHTWEKVPIEAGQTVEIRAKANSNLSMTENAGCRTGAGFMENGTLTAYAWARGRWNGIELAPSEL